MSVNKCGNANAKGCAHAVFHYRDYLSIQESISIVNNAETIRGLRWNYQNELN